MSASLKSIELLFVSKVRIKTLQYFLLNPSQPIHLRGAVRMFNEEINAVRRELMRLEQMKLITSESQGNRKYFSLNVKHILIDELMGIFHKAYGLGAEIIQNSKKLGTIDFAMLTPAYTKSIYIGDQAIDFAIVGNIEMQELESLIKKYEDKVGKEIHYTVLKGSEFHIRKRRKDEFLTQLLTQDLVMLIGSHEDLVR